MSVIAVIGAQWGDEGKGKIVDLLAERAHVIVRFSGGDNAGHTVINSFGEFKFHLVPSGIFSPQATCVIGNGVAVNPKVLLSEMEQVRQRGVNCSRLYVSDRSNLIMPYHTLLDGLEEKARGGAALGTTLRGIGPAFTDKIARMGIRTGELLDRKLFLERLKTVMAIKNNILVKVYGAEPLSVDEVYRQYCEYGEQLAPHIRDTSRFIDEAIGRKELVILEGAQGALLDPDFGTYPYVTSSSPLVGGGILGSGLSPSKINHVLGIFKAYSTRVGSGPMPTELKDETGNLIRERAHEYGATTGRARRCGWFDAVAGGFTTRINGFKSIALTRLDVLDEMPALKICTAYKVDGRIIDDFPASIATLERVEPVYEEMPGWQAPTTSARKYGQLPLKARRYVARLEELLKTPVSLISVGARRDETIFKRPLP